MNEKELKTMLEHCRNEDFLEELEINQEGKYLFFDNEYGYYYPINNTRRLTIGDFIKDIKASDCPYEDIEEHNDYSITEINKLLDLKKLKKVLSKIDSDIARFLNEIVIIVEEDSIMAVEEYLGTELLEGCVGQSVSQNGSIIINMDEIFNHFRDISPDKDAFFHDCVAGFYTTLLHELAHNYLRESVVNIEHTLLLDYMNDSDKEYYMDDRDIEEKIVELYGVDTFDALDLNADVFEPFNRIFIESKF